MFTSSEENHQNQHKLVEVPVSNIASKAKLNFFLDPMTQKRIKSLTDFNELIALSGSSNLVLNRLSQIMIKTTLMPEESYALFLFLQRQGWSNL